MSGNQTGRKAGKVLADARALEEQAERTNPLSGRGATPSMGLSQIRGGARRKMIKMEDTIEGTMSGGNIVGAGKGHSLMDHLAAPTEKIGGAKLLGQKLAQHLTQLHGAGYAREFCEGMGYAGAGASGGGASGGGMSGAGMSGAGMSGGEMSGCGMYPSGAYEGQGKPRRANARAAIVKRVMAERGVSMIEASRIVKAEGLK